MEENKSLSFDQLPSAVGELLTKVNTMMTRLDDIGQRIGNAPSENDHVLMDIREASAFVRKKVSSLYAYTSERRIPFYKRGNTLYFFKDQLINGLRQVAHGTSLTNRPRRNRQTSRLIWQCCRKARRTSLPP